MDNTQFELLNTNVKDRSQFVRWVHTEFSTQHIGYTHYRGTSKYDQSRQSTPYRPRIANGFTTERRYSQLNPKADSYRQTGMSD
jgi:hypothetical protein